MAVSAKVGESMAAGSWIRRMFEEGAVMKQRYGAENVFDLSLGNPIVEPPEEFVRELARLTAAPAPGMHRYMPNAGYPETRAAVAAHLASEFGLAFAAGEIVMTCGAAGALNVVLKTLLNPGDEVILFAPYFVEYGSYADNHGGTVRVLPTDTRFLPDTKALEKALTPRTRAVIINSPNNPTGVVYGEDTLRQMGEVLRRGEAKHGTEIYLLSDEPYRRIIYDGLKYPSPLHHHPRTVIVTSHSKDLALPGERIGYIALHPDCPGKTELVDGFVYCNRVLGFVNAPALMQQVIRSLQGVTVSVADYQRKRDYLWGELTRAGYEAVKPQGAFYLFPRSLVRDDVAFVRELQESRVLAVPGRGFGTPGYFRISYCVDDRTIEGAVTGLRRAAEKHRGEGEK
ncbi:MAG: pyridoxal phosphate-dependent aminotransferase [Chloroflexota bacterium]